MYGYDGTEGPVSALHGGPSGGASAPSAAMVGDPDDGPKLPHSHRCGARWSGKLTSHCGACCVTFTGVTNFDSHRSNGRCLRPQAIGLTLVPGRAYAVWGNVGERAEEEHAD